MNTKTFFGLALAVGLSAVSAPVAVQAKTMMVGGAAMLPTKNIVQNASKAKNLTTLVAAVKAAGLVSTLEGPGPFTVFAPTNDAFAKLPAGTIPTLLKPENKATLTKILTYHVVAGDYTAAKLVALVKKGHGHATVKTVQGETLTVKPYGKSLEIVDAKGGVSHVIVADVKQSNGVVHAIDTVLMPK